MNRKVFVPAAIAGVLTGLLSSLPVVSDVNLALCAWMWLGGILAVYLFRRGGAPPLTRAEGVTLGLLTGTVAGMVSIAFVLADISSLTNAARMIQGSQNLAQKALLQPLVDLIESGVLSALVGCIGLMLHLGFGALGGVIGAALITRRRL